MAPSVSAPRIRLFQSKIDFRGRAYVQVVTARGHNLSPHSAVGHCPEAVGMPKGQHDLGDGWTGIATGKKRRGDQTIARTDLPSKVETIDSINLDFVRRLKAWRGTACRKSVVEVLSRIRPEEGWRICNAVCLASGSFSRDNLECRKRTMWQFAVFVDVVEHLKADSGCKLNVVAQEPMYTPLDLDFMGRRGISVLQSSCVDDDRLGLARDHLGPDTFCFEPFMDMGSGRLRDVVFGGFALYIG